MNVFTSSEKKALKGILDHERQTYMNPGVLKKMSFHHGENALNHSLSFSYNKFFSFRKRYQ